MKHQIRPSDLPSNPPHGVSLYCPGCHCTYSACKGDYFWDTSNAVMKCGGKGHPGPRRNLILVQKTTRI